MQNIKQFVKERQEIKSLQTCESHFFHFSSKNMQCLSYKICPTKYCPSRYEVLHGHRRLVLLFSQKPPYLLHGPSNGFVSRNFPTVINVL